MVRVFVGDDWAEAHHDMHVMNGVGEHLVSRRVPEGLDGIREFHDLVGGLVDDPVEVVVGIETDRGLWVGVLVAAGYRVYAINPMSVARYRDRHTVSGAKSDAGDARNTADPPSSSASPGLPKGVRSVMNLLISLSSNSSVFMGVIKKDGAMAFTRIPFDAHSTAICLVICVTPPLLAQ